MTEKKQDNEKQTSSKDEKARGHGSFEQLGGETATDPGATDARIGGTSGVDGEDVVGPGAPADMVSREEYDEELSGTGAWNDER
ncbi:MAG TPA: hypothetical protein VFA78_07130 [Chloroflexota bacterium]|nr:hypothetical protein [Chloroflexota bacterium]